MVRYEACDEVGSAPVVAAIAAKRAHFEAADRGLWVVADERADAATRVGSCRDAAEAGSVEADGVRTVEEVARVGTAD